jgi:hypothetical protein
MKRELLLQTQFEKKKVGKNFKLEKVCSKSIFQNSVVSKVVPQI